MRDLTVSIVVYNNYDDVGQAVASIEKHTNPAISKKVFLIDNSCRSASDNDRQAFENKMSAYADVEYINVGENIGFGKGHNYAMNSYDSRFHAIVNPDITFSEDVFSGLIDFMNNTGAGMCIPRIVDSGGNLQKAYRREITVIDIMNRTFFRNMFKKRDRNEVRVIRHARVRKKISGTPEMPRLCVYRSNKYIYAQVIDDTKGITLVQASSLDPALKGQLDEVDKSGEAKLVGKLVAERAKQAGVEKVVFDRGGYVYTGRVAALAAGAREAGLEF